MSAVGYASLPISVDLRGIQKNIRSQVQGPMEAASKKAGDTLAKGFASGVDAAGREVKRLEALEKKAAETVISQQKKVAQAKAEVEARVKSVEAAEKALEAARAGGDAKVKAAEQALIKLRESGTASVADLEQAELKLAQVRASADSSVLSKEASLEKAKQAATKAAEKQADAEKKLAENQKFATGVSGDLLAATKRLDKATDEAGRGVGRFGGAFSALKEKGSSALESLKTQMKGLPGVAVGAAAGFASFAAVKSTIIDVGREFEETYNTIRSGTGASGEAFEGLKDSLRNVAGSVSAEGGLAEIGTTLADLNTRLGVTGEPLEELGRQFQNLKNIGFEADITTASKALNAFGVEAKDMPAAMDDLMRVSQATGVSMDDLAKGAAVGGPQLKQFGFDLGESAALIGKLDKAGLEAESTIGAMSKAMIKFADDGRDPQQALAETTHEIENLLAAGDSIGAINLAESVFGKSAVKFIEAVKTGALSVDDLQGNIGVTTDTINGLAAELETTGQKWGRFKDTAKVAIEPVAVAVQDFSKQALDGLIDAIPRVSEFFTGTLIPALQSVGDAFQKTSQWAEDNKGKLIAAGTVTAAVLSPLIVGLGVKWTQAGVKSLAGAAMHGKAWLIARRDAVKGSLASVKATATLGLSWMKAGAKALAGAAKMAAAWVIGLGPVGLVIAGITAVGVALWAFFTKTETGKKLWAGFVDAMKAGWEGFTGFFTGAVETVKNKLTEWMDRFELLKVHVETNLALIKAIFTGNWGEIPKIIGDAWERIKGIFGEAFENIKTRLVEWGQGVVERFEAMRVGVGEKVTNMVEATKKNFADMKDRAIGIVQELPGKIKGIFADAGRWLVDSGKRIITGLIDGIKSRAGRVGDAIRWVLPDPVERFVPGLSVGGVLPGYASGGVLPDIPGVPRSVRDPIIGVNSGGVPIARVEPGEFIVNREATRKHLPLLAAINGGRLNGKQGDLGLPRYADGGLVTADELLRFFKGERVNGQQASRSLEGATYAYGGSNWGDCSSTQGQGALFAVGKPATNGRYMATMDAEQKLSAIGFKPGLGSGPRFAVGWFNGGPWGGHTSGTIDFGNGKTINVEMGGGRGNGQIGGGAAPASHSQYTGHKHLPLAGASVVKPEAIKSTSVDGVTYRDSSGVTRTDPQFGAAQSLWEASKRSLGLYDNGGWLPHGGIAVNLSGKPERVLAAPELAGLNKIGDALGKLVKPWEQVAATTLKDSAINLGGGFLGRTKLVADAEKGLAEVRAQVAADLEAIGKAEADLAKAREAGDPEQIKQAEAALAKAREHGDTAAKRIEAAERTVAAARIQAAGEIAQKVFEGLSQAFQQVAGFLGQVAQFAEAAENTREEISKLHQQQVMLRIEGIKATNDLRVAEWDVAKVRLKGLLAVAKAEDELAKARKGHLVLSRSGVDGLSRAVNRFRITGAQSMEALGATFVANAAEVEAAEWSLQAVRAQANLDNLDAEYAANAARLKVAEATLAQAQAAELLQLQVLKLQDQTQRLYGMTSGQAQGAQGFVNGIGGIFGGLAKIIGGLAAGGAALATGNILGAVTAGAGALGGIQSLVGGIGQVRANKDDFKQAWSNATPGAKLGMGLGVAGGVLGGAVGIGGTLATGNAEWANAGAQLGGAFTGATMGSMMDYQKAFAEADARRAAEREREAQLRHSMENARLAAERAALDAKYAIKKQALASELDVAEVNKALAASEEGSRQRQVLVEAARTAAERRDSLVAEAKRANDLLGGSKQTVNITIDSSDSSQAATLQLIRELQDRVDSVEFNVTDKSNSAQDYVGARR